MIHVINIISLESLYYKVYMKDVEQLIRREPGGSSSMMCIKGTGQLFRCTTAYQQRPNMPPMAIAMAGGTLNQAFSA